LESVGDSAEAQQLGEYLECACSGVMACSTCHVVVAPEWFSRVGAPDEAEQDMLDLAYEPQATSRLGCQLVLTPNLDGLVVHLPRSANNLMDPIPFS
jgi:2Fe-2S ferredoxin